MNGIPSVDDMSGSPRPRPFDRTLAALALLGLAAVFFLSGHESARPPAAPPPATGRPVAVAAVTTLPGAGASSALEALVGSRPASALALIPADFPARLGYRPALEDGLPVNPGGSCSSPVPLPARFAAACRMHDFGYDLLRYAEQTRTPLPPHIRARLDARLVSAMHRSCTDPACHSAAELSRAGLALNTWRQRGGAPVRETGAQITLSVVVRVGETLAGLS